jgi:molybdate transport system permease protein
VIGPTGAAPVSDRNALAPAVAPRPSGPTRRDPLLVTVALVALGFLALPVIALLARAASIPDLREAITSPGVIDALTLSLSTTFVSLGVVLFLGVPLAWLLARSSFRGRSLAEAIVDLPIVLPPSVAGLALLLAFGRRGLVGDGLATVGVGVPFTTLAVIVAQVFVSTPFFVRATRAGLRSVSSEIEEQARVDGASERAILWRVTLPLSASAVGAGMVLAWARAMGEFGATIMFAGSLQRRTQTLPLFVYGEFQSSLEAAVAAAAILVLAALAVLVAVRLLRWPTGLG